MGACLSKKNACATTSPTPVKLPEKPKLETTQIEKAKPELESTHVRKEIFVIKHRRSHEVDLQDEKATPEIRKIIQTGNGNGNISVPSENVVNGSSVVGVSAGIRTSSCTKEELDAILIQCGRLSRSSSTGKGAESGGRKYSGSKRSYDFDNEGSSGKSEGKNAVDAAGEERENRRRSRQSPGRRRTPSRERDQRSGSRERGGSSSGGGRRVSRSPIRRSESPGPNGANSNSNPNPNAGSKPGKMVSVPATVTSLAMDKSTNAGEGIRRIQVKRNVGGGDGGATRTGASPRARSPARMRANEGQGPVTLSRSNSRKAEHSPYRRNPLGEIDNNAISQAPPVQKPNAESRTVHVAEKKQNTTKNDSSTINANSKKKEQHQANVEETKVINVISSGPESLKPPTITRTRSSRLSRDFDINPETLQNPTTNYTTLLLEDIHNFHQKNTTTTTTTTPAFSLPPCVTKAHSILEAVADLNSSTGSNLSTTFSEELRKNLMMKKSNDKATLPAYVESEVVVAHDDLMEPSFHKYVTVRRGTTSELEDQESSGSNSFVSSQQMLGSSGSSCWEPNSAESTDRWNHSSSRSVVKNNEDKVGNARARSRIGSRGPGSAPTAAAASN